MNPAYETVLIDTKTGGPIDMPPVKKKVKIKPRKKRVNGKAPAVLKAKPLPKGLVHMGKSLRLDPARRATRVMEFIEHYCGLKLAPFQIDYLEDLYRTNPKTGNLVHSRAIYSTGRKCGKTALTASQILAGVVGPESQHRDRWHVETHRPTTTQSRDRILVVANSREQSRITFSAVQKMVEDNDTLKGIVDCVQSTLRVVHKNRLHYAEFLGHNPRTAQGYEPVAWYFEELGSARDSRLLEALDLSQGTVVDPVGVCVSTNSGFSWPTAFRSDRGHPKGSAAGTSQGVGSARPCGSDPGDDPWKKKTILKANPAIGHFASWDYYRKQRDLAKKMPSRRAAYEAFVLEPKIRHQGRSGERVRLAVLRRPVDEHRRVRGTRMRHRSRLVPSQIDDGGNARISTPEEKDGDWCVFSECWLPHDGPCRSFKSSTERRISLGRKRACSTRPAGRRSISNR